MSTEVAATGVPQTVNLGTTTTVKVQPEAQEVSVQFPTLTGPSIDDQYQQYLEDRLGHYGY
ncbi:hypothetical protein H6F86_08445 [Phormidium sp. FACHB-592]|uniref:Uncharacterized protein n=1 Tax=Stenomitos frigidus AS-A4 TaxID=2933935 RepID=A0ABV0KRE6_9CYAN|nr:hypothetical protein [Phormidium sp. FACHB-592]MBD2073917.1 hypothetical protein [Phormidium sp. FACHB-592]